MVKYCCCADMLTLKKFLPIFFFILLLITRAALTVPNGKGYSVLSDIWHCCDSLVSVEFLLAVGGSLRSTIQTCLFRSFAPLSLHPLDLI